MPSWKGDINNPVPNPIQKNPELSEKLTNFNRSEETRRDVDSVKNSTITLMDIDSSVMKYLNQLQLRVVDNGNVVNVPIFYGSPEKWVSAQRDGFLRDKNGKIQLPALIFKRTSIDNDDNVEIFHRYTTYNALQTYSIKNKYTQFSILNNNVPLSEIYTIRLVDHIIVTYSFIIWTEYVEQMNQLIEKIKYASRDFWGEERGYRFYSNVSAFNSSVELVVDGDRVVRTEFEVQTRGYILPDTFRILDKPVQPTIKRQLTRKKILLSEKTFSNNTQNQPYDYSKWRDKKFPNLNKKDVPEMLL